MDHRESVILDFPRGMVRARYLLQPRQLQARLIARFSLLTLPCPVPPLEERIAATQKT